MNYVNKSIQLAAMIILSYIAVEAQTYQMHVFNSGVHGIYEVSTIDSIMFQEIGTVTDYDDNTYKTVKIGNQWWMAENLKVTHYRNGDAIAKVTDGSTWAGLSSGAYCNYSNDDNNAITYGSLYNGYAVTDSRNIAPDGWHVPTDAEWTTLTTFLDGESAAGGKLKEAGTTYWNSPNTGATNESDFTVLPGGQRSTSGNFDAQGNYTVLWSSTENTSNSAWGRMLIYNSSAVTRAEIDFLYGFSVRLIKN